MSIPRDPTWWAAVAFDLKADLWPASPTGALAYWIVINGGPPQDFEEAPFLN